MKIGKAKKTFGIEGTKKSRKQWAIAIRRGKTPNNIVRTPNTNPDGRKHDRVMDRAANSVKSAMRVLNAA